MYFEGTGVVGKYFKPFLIELKQMRRVVKSRRARSTNPVNNVFNINYSHFIMHAVDRVFYQYLVA